MKLFALFYALPLLCSYITPYLREQLTHYQLAHQTIATPAAPAAPDTQDAPAAPATTDTQDATEITPPLITRPKPGQLPRNGRSRNLSELCDSPKTEIPCVLALHRTQSAAAHLQPQAVSDHASNKKSDGHGAVSAAQWRCVRQRSQERSPLSLGHAAISHFDFELK
jgi:hypothetical protein